MLNSLGRLAECAREGSHWPCFSRSPFTSSLVPWTGAGPQSVLLQWCLTHSSPWLCRFDCPLYTDGAPPHPAPTQKDSASLQALFALHAASPLDVHLSASESGELPLCRCCGRCINHNSYSSQRICARALRARSASPRPWPNARWCRCRSTTTIRCKRDCRAPILMLGL